MTVLYVPLSLYSSWGADRYFAEMWSGSEEGLYVRRID